MPRQLLRDGHVPSVSDRNVVVVVRNGVYGTADSCGRRRLQNRADFRQQHVLCRRAGRIADAQGSGQSCVVVVGLVVEAVCADTTADDCLAGSEDVVRQAKARRNERETVRGTAGRNSGVNCVVTDPGIGHDPRRSRKRPSPGSQTALPTPLRSYQWLMCSKRAPTSIVIRRVAFHESFDVEGDRLKRQAFHRRTVLFGVAGGDTGEEVCRRVFAADGDTGQNVGIAAAVEAEVAVDVGERSLKVAHVFRERTNLDRVRPPDLREVVFELRHFLTDGVLAGRFEDVLLRKVGERLALPALLYDGINSEPPKIEPYGYPRVVL